MNRRRPDTSAAHRDFPWLDADAPDGVARFLAQRHWLAADETVTAVAPAGEGNMNLTLRVTTDRGSYVLKQARPWVEKYPFIEAPWDRAIAERRFYEAAHRIPALAPRLPGLLAYDDAARVLLLTDLGEGGDFTDTYAGTSFDVDALDVLGGFAAALHTAEPATDALPPNRGMRTLNHTHIYHLPTRPDEVAGMGLDFDAIEPGLASAARRLADDSDAIAAIARTGERYLADGPAPVHGDFFPGSFIRTGGGPVVIDGEFSHLGDGEFDVGNLLAHLALGRQPTGAAERFLAAYHNAGGPEPDTARLASYSACEVIRRLIGVAQLPLAPTTDGWRIALLGRARDALLNADYRLLWDTTP